MRSVQAFLLVVAIGLFVFSPGNASAWRVSQGSDFTSTINGGKGFRACDMESDGRSIWGKARDRREHEEQEADGGDRGCDRRPNPPDMGKVHQMETCERINNWPDACTGWRRR